MSAARQASLLPAQLSNDDLWGFFENHFSDDAVKAFDFQFLHPQDDAPQNTDHWHQGQEEQSGENLWGDGDEDDDNDGLGYYPDGVKRTLTDDEISIFRHSELHALWREREKAAGGEAGEAHPSRDTKSSIRSAPEPDAVGEDGEDELREQPVPENTKKRKRKGKHAKPSWREPKPDLRKRTWDIVDTGLDSLNYE